MLHISLSIRINIPAARRSQHLCVETMICPIQAGCSQRIINTLRHVSLDIREFGRQLRLHHRGLQHPETSHAAVRMRQRHHHTLAQASLRFQRRIRQSAAQLPAVQAQNTIAQWHNQPGAAQPDATLRNVCPAGLTSLANRGSVSLSHEQRHGKQQER